MPTNVKALSGITGQCIDTTENWTSINPLIPLGLICIEDAGENGYKIKIGDGLNTWDSLEYYPAGGSSIPQATELELGLVKKATLVDVITATDNFKYISPYTHAGAHIQNGNKPVPANVAADIGKSLLAGAADGETYWGEVSLSSIGAAATDHSHDVATPTEDGFMSSEEHLKLIGIELSANNYVHPLNHLPSVITEDADHRFVTDVQKAAWDSKQDPETTLAGYGITDAAPLSHVGTSGNAHAVATQTVNGFLSSEDKTKLDGIADGATQYVHPVNHPATIITEDSTHRFVSDTEKSDWTNKQDPETTLSGYGIVDAAPLSHVGSIGTSHGVATDTDNGFMSAADKVKLNEVEAQANNYIHPTNHAPSVISQDANNRFVTDAEKLAWNAKQGDLGFTPENVANKNINGGYAGLDSNGKLLETQIPAIAIVDVFEASSELDMLALYLADKGDVCIRSDINKSFILASNDYDVLENWKELRTPTDVVLSVSGKTGVVILTKNDVGLGNVDNTADVTKVVLSASKLTTVRNITLNGDVSGTTTFDGSIDATITVEVQDNSHNHLISNITDLQNTLDAKAPATHIGAGGAAHDVATNAIDGFMSAEDKDKLDGIVPGATNYTHPTTHDASMIVEDSTHRFVSDVEKSDWSGKQDPETTLSGYGITDATPLSHVGSTGNAHGVVTESVNGFMSSDDKAKLNTVAANANNYVHPNHSGDVASLGDGNVVINDNVVSNAKLANVPVLTIKGRVSAGTGDPEDLTVAQVLTMLDVEAGANVYEHPLTHPATMITEDTTHRFASDMEKADWNGKPELGELSTDAYRGDRGKTAYDHSQIAHAPADAQKNSDITKLEIETKLTGDITSHSHTDISGNAGTATKLATPVEINGVAFDGSAPITIEDSTKQPLDADLTAIAGLAGTNGLVKKIGLNSYELDTAIYAQVGHTQAATTIVEDSTHRFVTDAEKLVWNDMQGALGYTPENSANKNTADGYAGLDSNGKLLESQLPALAITDTFEAASEAAMLLLSTAQRGDVCIRSDINKSFILSSDNYGTLADWKELRTPTDTVLSVSGKTGAVVLDKNDVGLNNVDNTTDANKPISTATQTALDAKVPTTRTVNTKPLSADVVLTTADIADSTDKRYVTEAQITLINSTSSANTGDETSASIGDLINTSTAKATPVDADMLPIMDSAASNIMKKLSWLNLKATLKTYFDTLYNKYVHPNHSGDVTSVADGATTISNNVVSNAKLSTVNTGIIKGRSTAGSGNVEDLTAAQVRTLLNVSDGATAYTHPVNHPATIITEDSTHRFVTDAEKLEWDGKSELALGETSLTAYQGDKGKIAYDHSQAAHAPIDAQKNADITKAEIEAKFTGTITTHTHTLNGLAEKSFTSLTDKPTTVAGYGITDVAPLDHVGAVGDAHGDATTLVDGFMTTAQVIKLNGIALNANNYTHPNHSGDVTSAADGATSIVANTVDNAKLADMSPSTIKGRISTAGDPQDLSPAQVRTMLNVADGANAYSHPATHPPSIIVQDASNRFVSDTEKSTWNGKQNALGFTPENTANKNVANGYAGLDSNGKLLESSIPSIALMDTYEAASKAAMLLLSGARVGDICIRTDENKTYILATDGYSVLANWKALRTPTDTVISVAGKTGAVTLVKGDVGLGNVDNTTDLNKPVSTATQTALNAKVDETTTVNGKALSANVVLTTTDIADSTNKRYITDAQRTVLGNTSGTNSGNETATTLGTLVNTSTAKTTPVDADMIPIMDSAASNILKKVSWLNIKSTLKTYFDTLYNKYVHPTSGVGAGTYKSVTVDIEGHVTAGSNPTTLAGYGITDATPLSHVGSKGAAHDIVTDIANGFMSTADKVKIDTLQQRMTFNYVNTTGATYLKFAETVINPGAYSALLKVTITSSVDPLIVHIMYVAVEGNGITLPIFQIDSKTNSTSVATSGLQQFRGVYPKVKANGYKAQLELYFNTATQREIVVEVIESNNITILPTLTVSNYNTTYQSANAFNTYYNGIITNGTVYGSFSGNLTGNATSANSVLFPTYTAGEALTASDVIFLGTDNKWYKALTADVVIPLGAVLARCNATVAAAANVTAYVITNGALPAAAVGVVGKDIFIRGTIVDNTFVSDGTTSTQLDPGYSYMRFGSCTINTTTCCFDGNNRVYTIDANANLIALDNTTIGNNGLVQIKKYSTTLADGATVINLPWLYNPLTKNVMVFLGQVYQNDDTLEFTDTNTITLTSPVVGNTPVTVIGTFSLDQTHTISRQKGTLLAGTKTINLPWAYDVNDQNVLVFLGSTYQHVDSLNYIDNTTIELSETVDEDTPYEVIRTMSLDNKTEMGGKYNYIINGNFDIWQRAASQTIHGYGSDDRWGNWNAGTTKTHSKQAFAAGEVFPDGTSCPSFYSRTAVTSVVGVNNYCHKHQKIESVKTLAGKKAVLAFYAKADANKNIAFDLVQSFGTGGTPSSPTSTNKQKIALTSTWKKYVIVLDVPSIFGKVLGTNNDDCLWIRFWLDAGTSFNTEASTLGQQSGTFDIAQVSLIEGDKDINPITRSIGEELELCKRFFRFISFNLEFSAGYSSDVLRVGVNYSSMRIAPVISPLQPDPFVPQLALNNLNNLFENATTTCTIMALASQSAGICRVLGYRAPLDAEL